MFPSDSLLDKYGPIMLIAFAVFKFLPGLVRDVMKVTSRVAEARATVNEGPYRIANTALENSVQEQRRNLESEEALRATIDSLKEEVREQFREVRKQFKLIDDKIDRLIQREVK